MHDYFSALSYNVSCNSWNCPLWDKWIMPILSYCIYVFSIGEIFFLKKYYIQFFFYIIIEAKRDLLAFFFSTPMFNAKSKSALCPWTQNWSYKLGEVRKEIQPNLRRCMALQLLNRSQSTGFLFAWVDNYVPSCLELMINIT